MALRIRLGSVIHRQLLYPQFATGVFPDTGVALHDHRMQPDSGGLLTRAAALAAGYTDNEIVRLHRRGVLRKVGTGIYVPACSFDSMTAVEQHIVRARAATYSRRSGVISHQSAAAVHGLDLWDTELSRVHLTVAEPDSGSRTADRHTHARRGLESVSVDGIPVTPLSRTVLDCARTLDFEHAVVIGDSALRADPGLDLSLGAARGQTGISAARRAVGFMDGLSESPGESLSRIRFHEHGVPTPTLQFVIPGTTRRVDFCWDSRVVGEFDGLAKYGGRGESLAQEKAREDEIRDRGYEVFRWTWRDLFAFERVVYKYERAMARALRR